MIFTPKMMVSHKTATELKSLGAWNDDYMVVVNRLPKTPKFLQDPCLSCQLWDNQEEWINAGCPVCKCED